VTSKAALLFFGTTEVNEKAAELQVGWREIVPRADLQLGGQTRKSCANQQAH